MNSAIWISTATTNLKFKHMIGTSRLLVRRPRWSLVPQAVSIRQITIIILAVNNISSVCVVQLPHLQIHRQTGRHKVWHVGWQTDWQASRLNDRLTCRWKWRNDYQISRQTDRPTDREKSCCKYCRYVDAQTNRLLLYCMPFLSFGITA